MDSATRVQILDEAIRVIAFDLSLLFCGDNVNSFSYWESRSVDKGSGTRRVVGKKEDGMSRK